MAAAQKKRGKQTKHAQDLRAVRDSVNQIERASFTVEQFAVRHSLSRSAVYRLIKGGELKARALSQGKRPLWRITRDQEEEFLNARPLAS